METDAKSSRDKSVFTIWLLTLLGGLAWNTAIFAAPLLRHRAPAVSTFIYSVFSPLCHQAPDRCFSFQGYPLAVCGRCLGIYFGFIAGMLLYPFQRGFRKPVLPSNKAFFIASLPIGMDVVGTFFRLWTSPIRLRFVTGLLWGIILPFYLITGLHEALGLVRPTKSSPQPSKYP